MGEFAEWISDWQRAGMSRAAPEDAKESSQHKEFVLSRIYNVTA
jgi:hypothetical protein